jgi:hypothetical protein
LIAVSARGADVVHEGKIESVDFDLGSKTRSAAAILDREAVDGLERETRIEPATFSLGNWA